MWCAMGETEKTKKNGEDATIQMIVVVVVVFRPTMHASRPRSQQAGA